MAAAGATPASASLVGNAFISQYYNVLHQSPSVVHRFYTDQSQLTRDTGDGSVATVSTQQEINAKIMAMDLTDFKAEIKSVVSQNSLNGGVLVMVTGTLSCQSTGKRSFVQTFFLAPQEKGYFVLNDVLRYVDEPKPLPYSMANGVADATVASIPQQAEQFESEELVTEESYVPEEYVVLDKPAEKAAAAAAEEPRSDAVVVEEPVTVVEVETVSEETTVTLAVEPEEPVKKTTTTTTTTKMSYASIVNQPGRPAPPPQFVPKPAALTAAAPAAPVAAAAAPVEEASIEGPGIFISNLTLDATDHEIESKFREFGAIKPGSLQIKTSKEKTYAFAFLDFQDQQSAANAVEASGSVDIAGRMTKVEYKKPIGAGRGRGYAGRDREGGRGGGGGGGGYDREGGGRGGGYDREGGGGRGGGGGFGRRTDNTDEAGFRRQDQRSSRRGYGRGG